MGAVLDLLGKGGGGGAPAGPVGGGGSSSEPIGASTSKQQVVGAALGGGHHGGLGGLLHETLGIVGAAPSALVGLVGKGARDVYRFKHDAGVDPTLAAAGGPSLNDQVARIQGNTGRVGQDLSESTVADLVRSFQRTGSDVIHPTHFARAYHEGHLVGKLVEDLANASIVASPVAKAFTGRAVSAEEASTVAKTAAENAAKEAEKAVEAESKVRASAHAAPSPVMDAELHRASTAAAEASARAEQLARDAEHLTGRAERAARVAQGVKTAQKLGDRGSNAPFLPFEAGAKLAGAAFGKAEALGEGSAIGRAALSVGEHARGFATKRIEQRLVDNIIHEGEVQKLAEGQPVIRAARERAHTLANPIEEGAHEALIQGHANAVAESVRTLEANGQHDLADQLIAHTADRLGYAPESLRLAVDVLTDAKHGPEIIAVQERMAKAEELAAKQKAPDTAAYLSGKGEPRGLKGDEPWQVEGTTAHPLAVQRSLEQSARIGEGLNKTLTDLGETQAGLQARRTLAEPTLPPPGQGTFRQGIKAGRPAAKLDAQLEQVARKINTAQRRLARLPEYTAKRLAEVVADVNNAPNRYRPMLNVGVDAGRWLDGVASEADKLAPGVGDIIAQAKAELVITLHDAVAGEIDPSHIIGGRPGGGTARKGSPPGTLPARRKTGAYEFGHGTRQPTNIRDETKLQLTRAAKRVDNETAATIQQTVGRTGVELLGEGASNLAGTDLRAAMADRGYVPWNPAGPGGGVGFEMFPDNQIRPDTPFISKHVYDRFQRYQPKTDHALLKLFDSSVRVWKAGVLPLSPRWQVGNFFGNAILGTFGAGIKLGDWSHAMIESKRILDEHGAGAHGISPEVMQMLDEHRYAPAELLKRGQAAAEFQRINELGTDIVPQSELRGRLSTSLHHPIQSSYNLNGYVDDMNRMAIFLVKAEKGLAPAERGFFLKRHPEFAHLSDTELTKQWAITESLRAAGDFTRLTPFERSVARRVVPFYPWLRHITKLTYDLAAHHPARVAWALHLTDMFGEPQDLSIVRGDLPAGNQWFIHLPQINPFDNVFSNLGAEGPQGPLGSLNPAIKTVANLGGLDLGKFARLQQPPGFGPTDEYGRPTGGILGPQQYGYLLGSLSPQFSAARVGVPALWGHNPVIRYPTGEAIHIGGADLPTDPSKGIPRAAVPLARLLGLPTLEQVDLKAIQDRAAARRRQDAASRKRYNAGG